MKLRSAALVVTLLGGGLHTAAAVTLVSLNLTPIDGTAWGNSQVRANLGHGLGPATFTFTSFGGAQFTNVQTPSPYNTLPNNFPGSPTVMDRGQVFAPTEESVFSITSGPAAEGSSVSMTVRLDSGVFPFGSVFSARSLATGQRVHVGAGVSRVVYNDQLPSDGPDAAPFVYNTGFNYVYRGGTTPGNDSNAFAVPLILGFSPGNMFTVSFESNNPAADALAFTILTPVTIPEPGSALLTGAAGVLLLKRRRR